MELREEILQAEPILDEENLRNLFQLSFLFSQGNEYTQTLLFYWLSQNGYVPSRLPKEIPDSILSIHQPKKHDARYSRAEDSINIRKMWKKISDGVNNYEKNKEEWEKTPKGPFGSIPVFDHGLEYAIGQRMISSDLKFINKGRPGRKPDSQTQPDDQDDPRASFTRRFILQLKPAFHPAYNQMFSAVKERITQLPPHDEVATQLRTVGGMWENYHPGHSFFDTTPTPSLQEA